METTKNKIPENQEIFFEKLKKYLDTKIYFFGSVQRDDYFKESSDIDVAIFTDNVKGIIYKLQIFLDKESDDFKNFVWKIPGDNTIVKGYKVKYKNKDENFVTEISIYDIKYKEKVLKEYNGKRELPFYATWSLIFIKFLFYKLGIIPLELFLYLKNFILTVMISKKESNYVVLSYK
jgi:predicted nucleotidyltransferase